MSTRNKQSLLHGALILSVAAILSRVIGALFFKIPLQRMSMTAFGYFDNSYEIFTAIYTVATAGFPIAVSRMVAQSIALGNFRDVRVIRRTANRVFLLTGIAGSFVMFIAALFYPRYINSGPSQLTMMIMAPSILFCCMVSGYRGVCEGSRNMYPTAVSQIIEVIGKLLIGLGLASAAMMYGQWCFESGKPVYGTAAADSSAALSHSAPYISAGAMIGVTAGSVLAFIYVWGRHKLRGDGIARADLTGAPPAAPVKKVWKTLVAMAVPIALGTLATQMSTIIDVVSLKRSLAVVLENNGDKVYEMFRGVFEASHSREYLATLAGDWDKKMEVFLAFLTGNRGTAMTYIHLVPSITLTLGISAIPVISSAWALKDKNQLKQTVSVVLRVTALVAIPAGLGMSVLAHPLMSMIYGPQSAVIAADMLRILGFSVPFICLIGPVNAMFQAMGYARIPAQTVLVGGVVKLVTNIALVQNPSINIMGAAISTLICYVVMVVMSLYMLRRVGGIRLRWGAIFKKPLLSSCGCIGAAWLTYWLLSKAVKSSFATVSAVVIAVIAYVFFLFLFKTLTKQEILMLPKGEKIAETLEKRGWIG